MSKMLQTSKKLKTEREARLFMLAYNMGAQSDSELSLARIDPEEPFTILLDICPEEQYVLIASEEAEALKATETLASRTHKPAVPTNAEEFLKQYPNTRPNSNCCEDIACPECGERDDFRVTLTTEADLCDDGTDANCGDHEWGDESEIKCGQCRHQGKVKDFKFEGLDELIHSNEKSDPDDDL